jgi:3-hydroxyisobutyrate dehydrogenase
LAGAVRGTVGVVGLGTMGGRTAARFASFGTRTAGFDISADAMTAASGQGVLVTDSVSALAKTAQLIVLSLPGPAEVIETVEAVVETVGSVETVIDISTIDPSTARAASGRLSAVGIDYLDAPVLGRPASVGNWTLVASGPSSVLDRWRDLLEHTIAKSVVHAGEQVGSGSVVKVLNNLMFGAINAVTAEVLVACALAGVDPAFFADTVARSGAASVSGLFKELAPRIVARDFSPTFSLGLLYKDNELALRLGTDVGSAMVIGHAVQLVNSIGMNFGLATDDSGSLSRVYEAMSFRGAQQAETPQ